MKKHLLFLLLSPMLTFGQSYLFSLNSNKYTPLPKSQRIVISPNRAWNGIFNDVAFTFDIHAFNIKQDSADIGGQYISLYDPAKKLTSGFLMSLFPNNSIIDRNYKENQDPQTPALSTIAYLISGDVGDRIAKIEFSNVKYSQSNNTDSLYYQLWFYEKDERIEMHFGPSYIGTSREVLSAPQSAFKGFLCGLEFYDIKQQKSIENLLLNGSSKSPVLRYNESSALIDSFPSNGTVYCFSRNKSTAIAQEKEHTSYHIYPNPFKEQVHIKRSASAKPLVVQLLDITGKLVQEHTLTETETTLSTETLPSGMYLMRLQEAGQIQTLKLAHF